MALPVSDGGRVFRVQATVRERRRLSTRLGQQMAWRIEPAILGDSGENSASKLTLWSDLDAQRRRAAQDEDDTRRLFASERAFKAKDWTQVVQLLEPASDRLNPAAPSALKTRTINLLWRARSARS